MRLQIFFLFLFLNSCASITSSKQRLAVDSQPRNLEVLDEKGKVLGKTPFVFEFKRKRKLKLSFHSEKTGQDYEAICKFRIGDAGFGNLVFYYGLPLAIGIDLVSGAAFECPDLNTLEFSDKSYKNTEPYCRHYLILPPSHESSLVSQDIERLGRDALSNELGECDSIVSDRTSDEVFLKFGVDHKTRNHDFSQDMYNYWMSETRANTLVDFSLIETNENRTLVTMEKKDLFNQTKEAKAFNFESKTLRYAEGRVPFFKAILARIIPNTIAVGLSNPNPGFEAREGYEIKTERRKGTISDLDGYFLEFMNLSSPYTLKVWDADYAFKVSYPFIYEKFDNHVKNLNTNEVDEEDWTFFRFSVNLQIEGLIHTPIGAWGLGLGIAPSYLYTRSSQRVIQNGFGIIWPTVNFWYRAFIDQNLFFTLETLTLNEDTVADDRSKRSSFSKVSIGLGYFFPVRLQRFFLK